MAKVWERVEGDRILALVRDFSADPNNILFTKHAKRDRMKFRNVTVEDVYHCLQNGKAIDDRRLSDLDEVVHRVVGFCSQGKVLYVPVVVRETVRELLVITVIRDIE